MQVLRLQGGRFDAPDRTFFSLAAAWRAAAGRSATDVKELVPEFYLPGPPDFLVNGRGLPLGRRQTGDPARPRLALLPPPRVAPGRVSLRVACSSRGERLHAGGCPHSNL